MFIGSVIRSLSTAPSAPSMQGLVSEIATDPELGRVYREQVVEPRREQLRPVVERGIARGDLRPDTDVRLVHELLVGPIFYRLLFSGPPIDRKLGTRLVDAIMDSFSPAATTRKAGRSSTSAASTARSRNRTPFAPKSLQTPWFAASRCPSCHTRVATRIHQFSPCDWGFIQ